MNQAFYTGLSGMKTYQYGLDVTSNNLANINTIGFRADSTEFSTLFEDTLNTQASSQNSVGLGSQVQATAMTQSYGSFMGTDSATDLAIAGDGWFGVTSGENDMYTRAGAFTFDADRNLVSYDGMYLLGTMGSNIEGNLMTGIADTTPMGAPSAQSKMTLPSDLHVNAEPTSYVNFSGNLTSSEDVIHQSSTVISPNGDENFLLLEYTKSTQQPQEGIAWDIVATLKSKDGETVYDTQAGSALFDSRGAIESFELPTFDNNGVPLNVNLGESFSGVTSIDNVEVSYSSEHDGRAAGDLVGYGINANGEVIASFDNGVSSSAGRVAIFHFGNDQGLERVSGTHFQASANSGDPMFYTDEAGEYMVGADLKSFTLENSNLQYDNGLTELIILQRALDANAKSITTGDELIQKALEMDA